MEQAQSAVALLVALALALVVMFQVAIAVMRVLLSCLTCCEHACTSLIWRIRQLHELLSMARRTGTTRRRDPTKQVIQSSPLPQPYAPTYAIRVTHD